MIVCHVIFDGHIHFFFLFAKNSLHACIIVVVSVVSLSNAYCFSCFTRLLGSNQVVLTFMSSLSAILVLFNLNDHISITIYTELQ
jgi:hypothetical protein